MKKSLIHIAVAMVAALTVVSCKNNRKAQVQEPTQEEIQEQKLALTDSVLAKIDEYAEQYIKYSDDGDFFEIIELTDEDKQVKPDYLLDPNEAAKFVTKNQKVNSLAIYVMEYCVRLLYDMPTDEVKKVIAKLAIDLNHPIDGDFLTSDRMASDYIREEYKVCKERGDVAYFWQFENAILREIDYLIANNTELYLSKISEENLASYNEQWHSIYQAVWALAPFDSEMALIYQSFEVKNEDEFADGVATYYPDIETTVKTYKSDVYHSIEKRNALLQ